MNADTIAMLIELGIIIVVVPALVIAARHEIRLRRIRRMIAQMQPAIDGVIVAMRGFAKATEAVLPTLLDLAEALKPFADAAAAYGTTTKTEETS